MIQTRGDVVKTKALLTREKLKSDVRHMFNIHLIGLAFGIFVVGLYWSRLFDDLRFIHIGHVALIIYICGTGLCFFTVYMFYRVTVFSIVLFGGAPVVARDTLPRIKMRPKPIGLRFADKGLIIGENIGCNTLL